MNTAVLFIVNIKTLGIDVMEKKTVKNSNQTADTYSQDWSFFLLAKKYNLKNSTVVTLDSK